MPTGPRRHSHLAADLRVGLEQHHGMPTLGADPRRLQPRGSAADHHDPLTARALDDNLRDGGFPSGGRIVQAERLHPGRAVLGAHPRPDLLLLAGQQLARDVWVGDLGAGHSDQVGVAGRQGVPGRRQVGDPPGVEHRYVDLLAKRAGDIHVLAERPAEWRDDAGQFPVGVRAAVDHREEVDQPGPAERRSDVDACLVRQAAFHTLVTRDPHADDEARPDLLPDTFQHVDGEPHAVAQRAAIAVLGPSGVGRNYLYPGLRPRSFSLPRR